MEQQHIDYDRKLLDSPKELFASLVELEFDGTVQLIHETTREYVRDKAFPIHGVYDRLTKTDIWFGLNLSNLVM
jgi:hypothetical protein